MIDYRAVMARYGIAPRGVVHVGGFLGTEEPHYRDMGFANRLFVEAQPDTFAKLRQNLEGSGAFCEQVAVSEKEGEVLLHVAANDMSSSILPLKKHLEVYPSIVETRCVAVRTIRLDDLLAKEPYKSLEFNFMNVDVQGAEMLVMLGATLALKKMDFLNLEVNFDELYEGAPHVSQLDAFLSAFDFIRADTLLMHATWGDAIWIKNSFTRIGSKS